MSTRSGQLRRRAWGMFHKLRGEYLVKNGSLGENPAGAQCVNIPGEWWYLAGIPARYGNASDYIGTSDLYREWLPATTELRLTVGDIAVFRPELVGPNGHVDLVLDGSREPWAGLDQNWPLGAPCAEVWHSRAFVAGVIRNRG